MWMHALQRKSLLCIPRKEIARKQSQFPHSCVCEQFLYSHIFSAADKAYRSWDYINRLQTHECGNWDWGRAIPFLGIFVSNFRYCVFAVWVDKKMGYRRGKEWLSGSKEWLSRGKEWLSRFKEWLTRCKEWLSRGKEWQSRGKEWLSRGKEWLSRGKKWLSRGKQWRSRGKEWISRGKVLLRRGKEWLKMRKEWKNDLVEAKYG